MMRFFYVFLLSLMTFPLLSLGQNQANVWAFSGAGLDFNSGNPQVISIGMYATEATAAICDDNGSLLFYTNGGSWDTVTNPFVPQAGVFNANHTLMPNGALIDTAGCSSASQGTIILPDPGSPNEYFIFTQDCAESTPYKGVRYTKVDMTLDGGLGDVTQVGIQVIPPGQTFGFFVPEEITAMPREKTDAYWVLSWKGDSLCRVYVDHLGVSPYQCQGVIQHNPMVPSPDGDQLIIGNTLLDFDGNTGLLSNPVALPFSGEFEFSPNSRFIYVSTTSPFAQGSLFQLDQNDPDFPNNGKMIHPVVDGALKLAPNCKIYVLPSLIFGGANQTMQGVINFPNKGGVACMYEDTIYANASGISGQFFGEPYYYKPFVRQSSCPQPIVINPHIPPFDDPLDFISSGDVKNNTTQNNTSDPIFPVIDGIAGDPNIIIKGGGNKWAPTNPDPRPVVNSMVYPNPVILESTLTVTGINSTDLTMMITDLLGNAVRNEVLHRNSFRIKSSSFQSGLYIYTIYHDLQPLSSGKFVIQ